MNILLFFKLIGNSVSIAYQWARGAWRLSRIEKPIISIFGGRNVAQDSAYGTQAYYLAAKLAARGFFLLTGGGPGAMEAVHCGAMTYEKNNLGKSVSLGIGVRGVDEDFISTCG